MELKHAILGLLTLRPMSGYDLGRAFAGSVAHFWHADQSQIYRTIERLSAAGAIETEVIPQDGKPARKVHSLTDIGQAELDRWLSSPLEPVKPKIPLLARVFFGARLGRDGLTQLLDQSEDLVRDELARLQTIKETTETDPPSDLGAATIALQRATLAYGIAANEAELQWLQETRRQLAEIEDWS